MRVDEALNAEILSHLDRMLSAPDPRQPENIDSRTGAAYPFMPADWRDVCLSAAEVAEALREAKLKKQHRQKTARYNWVVANPRSPVPVSAFGLARAKLRQAYATIPGFKADKAFRRPFVTLCLYFAGDPRFELIHKSYSLNKGIGLFGKVGPGKTTLLELFTTNPRKGYGVISVRKLVDRYEDKSTDKSGGVQALAVYCRPNAKGGVCFDDLGTENPTADHYGSTLATFPKVLLDRYDLFRTGKIEGIETHFTTNLPYRYKPGNPEGIGPEDTTLESLYKDRVASRMREMFNFIAFDQDAPDRRK